MRSFAVHKDFFFRQTILRKIDKHSKCGIEDASTYVMTEIQSGMCYACVMTEIQMHVL
jgi:hypothetical protein